MAESERKNRYDTQVAEKGKALFARKFSELVSDTATATKLREYLGVSSQAIGQFKLGTTYPKTENLMKIADFFGISIDYLLGFSDVPNRDESLQAVNAVTGLSVGAIVKLNKLKNDDSELVDIISEAIEDNNLEFVLAIVRALKKSKKSGTGKELIKLEVDGVNESLYKETHLRSLLQLYIYDFVNGVAGRVE